MFNNIGKSNWVELANVNLKSNSERIDFARLALILLIVILHFRISPEATPSTSPYIFTIHDTLKNSLLLTAVPLLSIMSGYIFFARQAYLQKLKTLKNKTRTILIPFLIFNLSLVIIVFIAQKNGFAMENRIILVNGDLNTWLNAMFALNGQPVNYPLHFLRDLLVVFIFAIFLGKGFARFPWVAIALCIIVASLNLDGRLILRDDVFLCFAVGGFLAVIGADIGWFEKRTLILPLLILLAVCGLFLAYPQYDLIWRVAGGLSMWPIIGSLMDNSFSKKLSRFSRFAFAIYLMHAAVIIIFFQLGIEAKATISGLLLWVFGPIIIAAIIIGVVSIGEKIIPSLTKIALGGRIVGKTTPIKQYALQEEKGPKS